MSWEKQMSLSLCESLRPRQVFSWFGDHVCASKDWLMISFVYASLSRTKRKSFDEHVWFQKVVSTFFEFSIAQKNFSNLDMHIGISKFIGERTGKKAESNLTCGIRWHVRKRPPTLKYVLRGKKFWREVSFLDSTSFLINFYVIWLKKWKKKLSVIE